MATVTPTKTRVAADAVRLTWEGMATGDTLVASPVQRPGGAVAAVQITGTFGGSTVTLQGSEDDSTYIGLTDVHGTAISATSAARFELSTAALYLNPTISGGTGDSVTLHVTLRNWRT